MMKHGIVVSNCAICRSNSLVRESINGGRQNRCMRVLYLAIPVGTDCDDHEQKDLYHEATYDAQPKPLFVSETNERHQSRSTYWNTEKHSPCKFFFGDSNIIVSFRRSWKPHRPTDTQDESKEVRRRDADDVVGAKVNAGTDLLPSAASSHTYNRVRRQGTQFCVTSNYGLFGIHKFGRNSIIHSSISQRKSWEKATPVSAVVAQALYLKERTGSHRRSWRLQWPASSSPRTSRPPRRCCRHAPRRSARTPGWDPRPALPRQPIRRRHAPQGGRLEDALHPAHWTRECCTMIRSSQHHQNEQAMSSRPHII